MESDDALFRKISIRILPLMMLSFFVCYLDRINIGFAKLQMSDDLGFSGAVYGFGAGLLFVGYFLFEVPSNIILHHVGARRWIARIMVTWGIISGLTAFVQTPMQFYIARFALGAAEAGFIPGVIYYLSQWYPTERRGRAWGIFYIALASSGLIGGPVSGAILQLFSGTGGLAGWQWLILIEAVPSLILGGVVLYAVKDTIDSASWLDEAEKQRLRHLIATDPGARRSGDRNHIALRELMTGTIITLTAIYFLYNSALYGIGFWMPTMIQAMGVTGAWNIGLLTALPSACAIVTLVTLARSSDHRRERRGHLAFACILGAVGFCIAVRFADDPVLGMIGLCLANAGTYSIPAIFWTVPTALVSGVTAATAIAMINSIGNLSGFVAPWVIGIVKDATGSTGLGALSLAAGLVVAAVLLMSLPRIAEPVKTDPTVPAE
jgi:MFS family permease